jgi:hypothetical protein
MIFFMYIIGNQYLWFTSKIAYNAKMNFYGQPNMFLNMIISCTNDLHLEQEILDMMNIND